MLNPVFLLLAELIELFGVDRIFDMLRTAVNITGDASCAVVVDRLASDTRDASAQRQPS